MEEESPLTTLTKIEIFDCRATCGDSSFIGMTKLPLIANSCCVDLCQSFKL